MKPDLSKTHIDLIFYMILVYIYYSIDKILYMVIKL